MIKLLLDENVALKIKQGLIQLEFKDVKHINDFGKGLKDSEVFEIAKNENLDYIINRIFRDLIPLNYNIDIKYINSYKDFFDEDFSVTYTLNKAA